MDSGIASLIGVVVGVIAANGAKFVEHYVQRRRAAQYLAVRVITALDNFMAGCVLVAQDRGQLSSDHLYVVPGATLPTIEPDSLDVDWKSIEPGLAYAVLALPNQVAAAVQDIADTFDPSNMPADDYDTRQFQFARLGIVANGVIGLLAHVGGLPTYSPDRMVRFRSLELAYERQRQKRESWQKEIAKLGEAAAASAESSNKVMREARGDANLPAEKKPDHT